MQISVSKSISFDPKNHTQFETINTNFKSLKNTILKKPWSPILWEGNRHGDNFKSVSNIVLDFDSGVLTIPEACYISDSLEINYIIATTKSHQKEKRKDDKVQPPCDRFRIIFETEETTEYEKYKFNIVNFMNYFSFSDESVKDKARFFFPCQEVIKERHDFKIFTLLTPEKDLEKETKKKQAMDKILSTKFNLSNLPYYIQDLIQNGCTPGQRAINLFKISAELAKRDFSYESIFKIIDNENPKYLKELGRTNEFERQIQCGYNRGKKERETYSRGKN
jgi:hypothetical protein